MALRSSIAIAWFVFVASPNSLAQSSPKEESAKFRVDVSFEGNERIKSPDLRRSLGALLADFRDRGVDESAEEDTAYLVERHYAKQGFPEARVEATRENDDGKTRLLLDIHEGKRTYLAKLSIVGASAFEEETLRDCFEWIGSSKLREFIGLKKRVFTQDVLEDGLECIRSLHVYSGWGHVQVRAEIEESSDSSTADSRLNVRVVVDPGPLIRLRQVSLEGVSSFPIAQVAREMKIQLHEPFDPRLPLQLRGRIVSYYKTRGFRQIHVEIERDVREDSIALLFRVKEGGVSRVGFVGIKADRTRHGVVARYLKFEVGDLYNESRVRESYRALLRSGLFDSVAIKESQEEESGVRFDIEVEEKNRYAVSVLAGYGSWEQLRGGLVLEDRSLFGTGHRLRGELGASFRGERGSLEYLNPHFFHEDFSQDFSTSYERREQRTFTSQEYGGAVGVGWRATERTRHRLSYRARESNVLEADAALPVRLARDVFIASVHAQSSYDTRDNFLNPRRGFLLRGGVEYAGSSLASDIDFLRVTFDTSVVTPLPAGIRFAVGASTGIIVPLGTTDVIPVQERFFLGGDDTVRSFTQDRAGPNLSGSPIGGESFVLLSSELRIPLSFLPGFLEKLDAAFFGDAGTVNLDVADYGGDRYFFAVGTGLRYDTPVGPLRLDLAANPDRRADEDLFVVQFALGYPF